ncbi:MAG: DNA-binding protein [Betaproteobacteria bacterium]|nr:MAG: DNA-binding protein [Betaproteobacteria bacterium]
MATETHRTDQQQQSAALLSAFWTAPGEAFFPPDVVALVLHVTPLTLAAQRWKREGLPWFRPGKIPLYRKGDVIAYIEGARNEPKR